MGKRDRSGYAFRSCMMRAYNFFSGYHLYTGGTMRNLVRLIASEEPSNAIAYEMGMDEFYVLGVAEVVRKDLPQTAYPASRMSRMYKLLDLCPGGGNGSIKAVKKKVKLTEKEVDMMLHAAFFIAGAPEEDMDEVASRIGVPIRRAQKYFYMEPDVLRSRMEIAGEFDNIVEGNF